MKDRLAEFRRKANITDGGGDTDGPETNLNGPGVSTVTTKHGAAVVGKPGLDKELDDFFSQIANLKRMADDLKADVDRVKFLQSKILSSVIPDERKKAELEDMMLTIKALSLAIRSKLRDMGKANAIAERKAGACSTACRIRRAQHSAILHNFMDIIHEYQVAESAYRDKCKARIRRQLELSGSKVTNDEIEVMIEHGNLPVFAKGHILETDQAKRILADVEARHDDILKLEKSLKELHELFVEMALLVENQGDVVDRIEAHVALTQIRVENAVNAVNAGHREQKKAREKKMWLIIILTLAVVVVVASLVIYFSL